MESSYKMNKNALPSHPPYLSLSLFNTVYFSHTPYQIYSVICTAEMSVEYRMLHLSELEW